MAVRAGYVFNYFLGQICFEINLKSLPMVVFATSLRLSLVNAHVSNSPLILSRDNLCCLIYFFASGLRTNTSLCLRCTNGSEKDFSKVSVFLCLCQHQLLVLSFLPPDQCTPHVSLWEHPLKTPVLPSCTDGDI